MSATQSALSSFPVTAAISRHNVRFQLAPCHTVCCTPRVMLYVARHASCCTLHATRHTTCGSSWHAITPPSVAARVTLTGVSMPTKPQTTREW
jgi:hypothetical protein